MTESTPANFDLTARALAYFLNGGLGEQKRTYFRRGCGSTGFRAAESLVSRENSILRSIREDSHGNRIASYSLNVIPIHYPSE